MALVRGSSDAFGFPACCHRGAFDHLTELDFSTAFVSRTPGQCQLLFTILDRGLSPFLDACRWSRPAYSALSTRRSGSTWSAGRAFTYLPESPQLASVLVRAQDGDHPGTASARTTRNQVTFHQAAVALAHAARRLFGIECENIRLVIRPWQWLERIAGVTRSFHFFRLTGAWSQGKYSAPRSACSEENAGWPARVQLWRGFMYLAPRDTEKAHWNFLQRLGGRWPR